MNKTSAWILIALTFIFAVIRLTRLFGWVNGILFSVGLVALITLIFFGLDRLYRWRSDRLLRLMQPHETLIASGLVSESISDETAAILVRGIANRYRLLIADARGAVSVQSVTPKLMNHQNPRDLKSYIEVNTIQGPMHFAPRKGFLIAGQSAYAREILDAMLAGSSLPASLPE